MLSETDCIVCVSLIELNSFLELLLSNLFDTEDHFHKNNRGDFELPGLDGSFILLDVMSVDPCNGSNETLVNSEIHTPLSYAENFKINKHNEPLSKLYSPQHAKYNLYPFVFFSKLYKYSSIVGVENFVSYVILFVLFLRRIIK
ncbi:hypothetical protein P9112_006063 [Eukaryota sp. TZLM1-RC]